MIHNLTGFPLRFGSADSEPLPVDGKAIVRAENVPAAPLVLDDGRSFAAVVDAQPTGIIGLDTDAYGPEDVLIVAEIVAVAMRRLGLQAGGAVYTPGLLSEENLLSEEKGVKFATAPKAHPDLAATWR